MVLEGVDYSSGTMSSATVKANGLAFVCRYVSTPGKAKNLTAAEVADFMGSGIGIVVVFEQGADNSLGGSAQGVADATIADSQVSALGLGGCPIYFAVDFDASMAQMPTIAAYLQGAASVLGLERTGVYGGYPTVKYAFDNGLVTYGWQTRAWSSGHIEVRDHIYQYQNDVTIGGVQVDRNRTISSDTDYGQVGPGTLAPGAVPVVTGIDPSSGDVAGGTSVTITGSGFTGATDIGFGPTNAATMSIDSDVQITATSAAGTGTVDVTVTTPTGTSATTPADQFTYVAN